MTDQAIHEILGLPVNSTNIVENVTKDYASIINEGFWGTYYQDMYLYKYIAQNAKWFAENLPRLVAEGIEIFFKQAQKFFIHCFRSIMNAVEAITVGLVDAFVFILMKLYIAIQLTEAYIKTVLFPAIQKAKELIVNYFLNAMAMIFGSGLAAVDASYEFLQYAFKNSVGLILPVLPPYVRAALTVGVVGFGSYLFLKLFRKVTQFAADTYHKPLSKSGMVLAGITLWFNFMCIKGFSKLWERNVTQIDTSHIASLIINLALSIYSFLRMKKTLDNHDALRKEQAKELNQSTNDKSFTPGFEKSRTSLRSKNEKVKKETLKKVTRKALPRHR